MARIAVLGPGGVGGLLAAALARAGEDVTVVAREATAAAIAQGGITLRSVVLGDFVAHPRAVTALTDEVDALVVATKATGLDAALGRIDAGPGIVVPLLNGLDHMATLRERFGAEPVVAGVIRVEADRPAPGEVVQTSPFLLVGLDGSVTGRRLAGVDALSGALQAAGVPVRREVSEAQVLWGKLVRLNALACMTSAHDVPLGAVRDDPELRAQLERAVAEAAAVAAAEGADVSDSTVLGELEQAHWDLGSSMQRDLRADRESELDAIPGAVLRAAARHGLACPTIEILAAAIRARWSLPNGK